MLTKNAKILQSLLFLSPGSSFSIGFLEGNDTQGNVKFIGSRLSYPSSYSLSQSIKLGSGTTPETENDYQIETPLTGVSMSTPSYTTFFDENENPTLAFDFTVTNNEATEKVLSEIALYGGLFGSNTKGANANTTYTFMIDRTVLSTPITIPANGYAAVRYSIKLVLQSE